MKKLIIPLLFLAMVAVFVVCGTKQASVKEETIPVVEEVQENIIEEPVSDIAASEVSENQ